MTIQLCPHARAATRHTALVCPWCGPTTFAAPARVTIVIRERP